jgi:hypothetical protein
MSDADDHRENVTKQARCLSAGTLSYLCGSTLYSVVDKVRNDFVEYCEETEAYYQSWQEAWVDYAKLKGYHETQ